MRFSLLSHMGAVVGLQTSPTTTNHAIKRDEIVTLSQASATLVTTQASIVKQLPTHRQAILRIDPLTASGTKRLALCTLIVSFITISVPVGVWNKSCLTLLIVATALEYVGRIHLVTRHNALAISAMAIVAFARSKKRIQQDIFLLVVISHEETFESKVNFPGSLEILQHSIQIGNVTVAGDKECSKRSSSRGSSHGT